MAEQKNFEEKLKRLEEIVKSLDDVKTPLDESLSLFEEGARLVKELSSMLDKAEQRVNILTRNSDGEVIEAPFDADESKR